MSRTVCSWCKVPLVLKDDILVCSNTDCPACDEKYLHEELIRTRKQLVTKCNQLEIAIVALKISRECAIITSVARGLEPKEDEINIAVTKALEQITALEQKDK